MSDEITLAVEQDVQWSVPKGPYDNVNCGPTVAHEIIAYYTGKHIDINALAAETPIAHGQRGLNRQDVVTLLGKHGIPAQIASVSDFAAIEAELENARPVIALIQYGDIPGRDDPYQGGHFVVIVGRRGDMALINDPDYLPARAQVGNHRAVPIAALMQAIHDIGGACIFTAGHVATEHPTLPTTILDMYHNDPWPSSLEGVALILHKASQAVVDPKWDERVGLAKDANIPIGAYHFGVAGEPEKQADLFWKAVEGKTRILALDWETNPAMFSKTMKQEDAEAFVKHLHAISGIRPLLYCNYWRPSKTTVLPEYADLWIAHWTTRPAPIVAPEWPTWMLWQYGSKTIGKISYDANRFNGTAEQLQEWIKSR